MAFYVVIGRWYNPANPRYDNIGWINGAEDGPSSLFTTMDEYMQDGVRMEILEVMGDLDAQSEQDASRMRAAMARHRKLLKEG